MAWLRVLNPGDVRYRTRHSQQEVLTFVAIHHIVLDDNTPAVEGAVRLGLAANLPEIHHTIFSTRRIGSGGSHAGVGHSDHMAGEELVDIGEFGEGEARFGFAAGQKHFGGGHQKDVVASRTTLGG